jgi:hypothetical protein
MTHDEPFLAACLDTIEQQEARILTWGMVDGFLSAEELASIIDPLLDDPKFAGGLTFVSVREVLEELSRRALLFDVGDGEGARFRSRMAETVRLLFRLRQLFPKHRGPTGWQTAPTLVADFRFIWRRRRYPRRGMNASESVAAIATACADDHEREAIATFVRSYGPSFGLARFQVDAAVRILKGLGASQSSATLVSAGTGSGKTLAFYLPALARLASHIRKDTPEARWVKVLALYPRNELLKDQFAEVYSQARRLDATLLAAGRRKILIGTFFGPTPASPEDAEEKEGWKRRPDGLVCLYLRCPRDGCGGDLIWRDEDRSRAHERLSCQICSASIESDEIVLTRSRLQREAPDVLFTTTEMLNQRMGDSRVRHLFGIGERAQRPVEMMLLDEVHTYSGATGAQSAFLLARWRQLLQRPVSFVGLSATLKDGQNFFARLTGVHELATSEIAPRTDDMISEGAEYLLALRGDPVSRTALLSTTVQTAMLLSRMLDSPDHRKSAGLYGERLFLFADNLDVINRAYFAVLDAEGRQSNGSINLNTHPNGGLATLRFPMPNQARKLHGQDWSAATDVGHTLLAQDRKAVGRVMSMDPGVDGNLDIVVATASLEVGFNDPLVGAVIQHKASADVAQFLQRKGRAGRTRRMRPWTVAVLSDYGRDRIAYQGYDLLFDPELPVRTLPIGNRHVQRIQAVYATLDYLSTQIKAAVPGSVWTNLYQPTSYRGQRARQEGLAEAIRKILTRPSAQDRLARYLAKALRLPADAIASIFWDHPRPLLTQVLPTALRRLETQWRSLRSNSGDYQVTNSPLPEFAPANLFGELNLPEVEIVVPAAGGRATRPVSMPIVQAMREFAPGRVSRRYGLANAFQRHWIAPQLDANVVQPVALDTFVTAEPLGEWPAVLDGHLQRLAVFRPRTFTLQQPANTVVDTSNARLRWNSQLIARLPGTIFGPPQNSCWGPLIEDIHFFTHQAGNPIKVRRVAASSDADIRFRDGTGALKRFVFELGGAPAALGFTLAVDAMCIRLRFPSALWADLAGEGRHARGRAIRTARFHHLAVNGSDLSSVDNPFAREWLAHLMLAAVTNEAIAKAITLQDASANLAAGTADLSLARTLDILFQSAIVDDANAQGNTQDRLRQDLAMHLNNPQVRAGLFSLAEILWAPITEDWEPWLRQKFAASVAAGAMNAILNLCPEIDADGLVVDVDSGPPEPDHLLATEPGVCIWISELAPGGNGHIEQVIQLYAEDPRRFFSLAASALKDNDFSLSDFQLNEFLETVVERDPDGDLAVASNAFREAYGAREAHERLSALRRVLAEAGFATFHSFSVALVNRVLRPGSGPESDAFFLDAMKTWDREEERLGVELDARVVAYQLARRSDIDLALSFAGIDAPTINPDQWRFSVIYGLLWPRGAQIRRSGLELRSMFADLPLPEPLLLRPFLDEGGVLIDLEQAGWQDRSLERLAEAGSATLTCPLGSGSLIAEALCFIATNPVQDDYLSVFARVQAIRRLGARFYVDVDIAEAAQ